MRFYSGRAQNQERREKKIKKDDVPGLAVTASSDTLQTAMVLTKDAT